MSRRASSPISWSERRPWDRSSKRTFELGSSWISASQSGSAAGAGVRPSKTSRGPNDSARATATSAVTPRAPPLMTTRSPRSM